MSRMDRRTFLKETAAASAGMAVWRAASSGTDRARPGAALPTRRIGPHEVSRLILGGNPFSFNAHSEPLLYSGELFRHYFTHEKVVETMALAEAGGVNTFLGRIDDNVIGFLRLFETTTGRDMPWLAQTSKKPMQGASKQDILDNIQLAADNGATGIYFHGESADFLVAEGRGAEIETYLARIRALGLVAGVGGHEIGTIAFCEDEGLAPDFYMKTLNRLEFCCPEFERTRERMASVQIPWIAFKVLAAGRIRPEVGFADALAAGADFLCVGMFDFQVERNLALVGSLLQES